MHGFLFPKRQISTFKGINVCGALHMGTNHVIIQQQMQSYYSLPIYIYHY